MACLTNTSIFTNGLGPGDVCSGRGQCIDGFCVCDELWTGRSDYIDLTGLACHYPILLDRVLFAIMTVAWTILWVYGFTVLQYQLERFWDRRKNARAHGSFFKTMAPLDTIFLTQFIAIPCFIASAILRQWQNFGVDGPVSYLYVIGLGLNWTLGSVGQHLVFVATVKGGMMQGAKGEQVGTIINSNKHALTLATGLFVSTLILCNIVTVYTPPGITPFRIAMVAVRNMGTVFYVMFHYFLSKRITARLTALVTSMADSKDKDKGISTGGADNSALVQAIDHLRAMTKGQQFLLGIFSPMLIVFTIVPQLYGYNQVPNAVMSILAAGPTHVSDSQIAYPVELTRIINQILGTLMHHLPNTKRTIAN